MPQQYDTIGSKYNNLFDLPPAEVEHVSVRKALGDISGLRVLDLACGTGRYTRLLRQQGAATVLGVDISDGMIAAAREAGDGDGLEFRVSDCSKVEVQTTGGGKLGGFDMVFAGWLFNYAANETELRPMWENVFANLKPGGRMVAVIPAKELDCAVPLDDRYGVTVRGIERVEHGWKVELTAYTDPIVKFQAYHILGGGLYERCAEDAGLRELTWHSLETPDDDRKETGFWDVYTQRPHVGVLTAMRPD